MKPTEEIIIDFDSILAVYNIRDRVEKLNYDEFCEAAHYVLHVIGFSIELEALIDKYLEIFIVNYLEDYRNKKGES